MSLCMYLLSRMLDDQHLEFIALFVLSQLSCPFVVNYYCDALSLLLSLNVITTFEGGIIIHYSYSKSCLAPAFPVTQFISLSSVLLS